MLGKMTLEHMNANAMKIDDVLFETIKESRDTYFIEYYPPRCGARFATLQLVFPNITEKVQIATLLESELRIWLSRYDVPIMAASFDGLGGVIDMKPLKDSNYVMGYLKDGSQVYHVWGLIPDRDLPSQALDLAYIQHVYSDIPSKTRKQWEEKVTKQYRQIKIGWSIFAIWMVAVPAAIAILGFANFWVGLAALVYSLSKAAMKALKLTGKLKLSAKESERDEKKRKMKHYYYHCERNPDGFNRLKLENFEKDLKEDIQKESEALKSKLKKVQ